MALKTNVIRWRYGRPDTDDEFRNPQKAEKARGDFYRDVLPDSASFRYKLRSEEDFGSVLDREALKAKIEHAMPKIDVGESIMVERDDGVIWALRKSREKLKLPIRDTIGNDDIDKIYTYAVDVSKYREDVGSLGICNRRKIAGSSSWSEHSPWGAPDPGSNAWDATWKSLAQQEDAVRELVKASEAGEIPMGYIISNRRAWKKGEGWHDYTGEDPHTSHAHIQGLRWHDGQTPQASC